MAQIASKAASNEIMKALFGDLIGGGSAPATSGAGGGLGSILSSFFGAPAPGMAVGGLVTGGVENRDSVPRTLMPDEFVLKRSAVDVIGHNTVDRMNADVMAKAPPVERERFGGSASAAANVYVVDRDQVPQPGPSDFVYAIGDNIQKGGSIKQLIKRAAAGGYSYPLRLLDFSR